MGLGQHLVNHHPSQDHPSLTLPHVTHNHTISEFSHPSTHFLCPADLWGQKPTKSFPGPFYLSHAFSREPLSLLPFNPPFD